MKPVVEAHRAPDPSPVNDPVPEPFETPHPHHLPVHTPQTDDEEPPVPDPNPSMRCQRVAFL